MMFEKVRTNSHGCFHNTIMFDDLQHDYCPAGLQDPAAASTTTSTQAATSNHGVSVSARAQTAWLCARCSLQFESKQSIW